MACHNYSIASKLLLCLSCVILLQAVWAEDESPGVLASSSEPDGSVRRLGELAATRDSSDDAAPRDIYQADPDGDDPAEWLVDQLSITEFKQTIADLASFVSRYWSQPGNALAVDYFAAKLESFGYTNVMLDPYLYGGQTRYNIYATKMGTVQPTEMYIIGAHMDSYCSVDIADAPGADDDASGTALVLEIARVFARATTGISLRFILFNNEETGLNGSGAYVQNHREL